MKKFEGILICTDLDGTLLRKDKTVSRENLEAIEYFKENGGYFTFITGRMPYFSDKICEIVKPNVPFGCGNGGAIYDYAKREYVWKQIISDSVTELAEYAVDADVEVIILSARAVFNGEIGVEFIRIRHKIKTDARACLGFKAESVVGTACVVFLGILAKSAEGECAVGFRDIKRARRNLFYVFKCQLHFCSYRL